MSINNKFLADAKSPHGGLQIKKTRCPPQFFTCPQVILTLKTVPNPNINTNPNPNINRNPNLGLRPRTPRQSSLRSLGGLIQ